MKAKPEPDLRTFSDIRPGDMFTFPPYHSLSLALSGPTRAFDDASYTVRAWLLTKGALHEHYELSWKPVVVHASHAEAEPKKKERETNDDDNE